MPDQTWIFQVLFQLLRFFIQPCGSCSLSYLCPQFKIRSVSFISKPLSIKINLLPTLKKTNNMGKNWDQDRFWFWSLMMWEEKPESKINNGEYHCSLFSERSVTIILANTYTILLWILVIGGYFNLVCFVSLMNSVTSFSVWGKCSQRNYSFCNSVLHYDEQIICQTMVTYMPTVPDTAPISRSPVRVTISPD